MVVSNKLNTEHMKLAIGVNTGVNFFDKTTYQLNINE